ncbi:MAG: DUF305 domain-containing protein [Snowella sp.]|jgi:uncharacterized protein (DUF305 family)|nr:MAG: DUF305 domain-containing protein [Snowella sp.]
MKNQLKYYLGTGLFFLLLFTLFPSLLGQMTTLQAQPPKPQPSPNYPGVGRMGMMDDQHFIVMMIPHHEDAIAMANMALTRAQHPEIKQLSENIKISQSREIEQMRTWYKKWYGTDVPTIDADDRRVGGRRSGYGYGGMMHSRSGYYGYGGMMSGMRTDLTALSNAKNFDQAFIQEMIPHHQMAVMMSQHLLFNAVHPEMKQLAQAIIQAQTKEINDMESWYQKWYVAKPQ